MKIIFKTLQKCHQFDQFLYFFTVPEEFTFDPVTKSYGSPERRPEIKSATIEFIAPSEYMVSKSIIINGIIGH